MIMIAWTTVAHREEAEQLARHLVETQQVACAQIDGPLTSVYRWKNTVQTETEFRLTLKFLASHAPAVEQAVHARHPYATPQWVVVSADAVTEKYLSWAEANSSSLPFNASQASL